MEVHVKKSALILFIASMSFSGLAIDAANATTFIWSYSGPSGSGGGTIQATLDPGDPNGFTYDINSIVGTANGFSITGLDTYQGATNLIFYPQPAVVVTDVNGFAFNTTGGAFNIYEDFGNIPIDNPFHCGAAYCISGPGLSGSFNPGDPVFALESLTLTATTPLPATWGMMLAGLAGARFLAYRRKSRPALAA
jgi:hypothetical protein